MKLHENLAEVVDFHTYSSQNTRTMTKGTGVYPVFVILNKDTREVIVVRSSLEKTLDFILSHREDGTKYVWKEFILDE